MTLDPSKIGESLGFLLIVLSVAYATFRAGRPQNPAQRLTKIVDAQAAAAAPVAPLDTQTLGIMGSTATSMQLLIQHLVSVNDQLAQMNRQQDAWQNERQMLTSENQRLMQENEQLKAAARLSTGQLVKEN